jgi:hypothetical protein
MSRRVLLIGRNPTVLAELGQALRSEGFAVQTTDLVEKASQDFNAANFDLIAFGRGVDEETKAFLKASFRTQHASIYFVDGLAPIIPLLVKQIKETLQAKPADEKLLTYFGCDLSETLTISIALREACQVAVDFYQLDAVHNTRQDTLISTYLQAGNYQFKIEPIFLDNTAARFLVAQANKDELTVLRLS